QPESHGAVVTLGDLFDGAEGAAAKIVVAHVPPAGQQSVLEASLIQNLAHNAGLDWNNAQGLHHIIVESGPAEPAPRLVRAEVEAAPRATRTHAAKSRHADQTLVYARNIQAGEILQPSDLEWSDSAVGGSDSPDQPEAIMGKAARRPLRAGMVCELHDLDSPKIVHRNELIDVVYEDDGVRVVLEGKAMGDASVGDPIQVMNVQSKKVIDAVASGPGQAVVGPAAERLKMQAYVPALRTASLR
ncbi:MAG: flagellar basal body P-ring formation chaperone FlgA, partial [Caulobacteraceae bacterium]